ncbi:MAG: cytochrome c [Candidatus Zixiibacteriota bacterium]
MGIRVMTLRIARKAGGGVVGAALVALAVGCQGQPSEKPPIHLNPNMVDQEKYKAYGASRFFADSAAMRHPPAGTVARGALHENIVFYTGFDVHGDPAASPEPVTMPLLHRGQERFNIYCAPCHGRVGDGRGIMVTRGYVPPPSFHDDRIRNMADGVIFDVITNGIRNMPSYSAQIPVTDRWAIIAYLRALQRSQNATLEDIPPEKRGSLK